MPCIIDGNKIIDTPITEIIEALQQTLYVKHIPKLRDVKLKATEAIVTCPSHKDGLENTPSCSIMLIDKKDYPAGTAHCFACGYKANIVKFCADCLGISYKKATEWLLEFVDYSIQQEIRDIGEIDFDKGTETKSSIIQTVPIEELKKYDFIHPYMFQRKLTDEVIEKFDVGYDPETDALTFPVYVNGNCLFVAKRKVKYKQFLMPKIEPKPIYGLDYITENEVVVCESVIDALYVTSLGYQAIALFGTGSRYQLNLLKNTSIRCFTLCFDGDIAGKEGEKRFIKAMGDTKMIKIMRVPNGKDANDLSKEEFDILYSNAEFI